MARPLRKEEKTCEGVNDTSCDNLSPSPQTLSTSAPDRPAWCGACLAFGFFIKYLVGVVDKLRKVDL